MPDIRALLAAVVAAIGLLTISFGVVATFRVAQDGRAGSLQADLALRGRAPVPDNIVPRAIVIFETPATEELVVVPAAIIREAPAAPAPALLAIPTAEIEPEPPAPAVMAAMPAEPETPGPSAVSAAIGGPLAEEVARIDAEYKAAKRARAKKAVAEKARKARVARQRRAHRAAQARAKQQAAGSFDTFNRTQFNYNAQFNSFGGYDTKPAVR